MRAVVITKHGGPEVLEVQERPDPPLGPGEVRIEVAAAGINFADVMARMGLYQDAPKTPCVVGYEVAGTILELGEGRRGPRCARAARARRDAVRRLRLAGRRARGRRRAAARAAELRAGRGGARQLRDRLGGADRLRGPRRPGERVLVHSAGGGVGIAATQIAKQRRRGGLRHGLARQARSGSSSWGWTARWTTRSPAGRRASAGST